jgi:LmbE family N-acetylglucosaminyl deacetylase
MTSSYRNVLTRDSIHSGFYRLGATATEESIFSDDISGLLTGWKAGNEGVLVVVPHDDDAVIGMGMLLRHLVEADTPLKLVIVTDGRLGYTSLTEQHSITSIRQRETLESCRILGIEPTGIQWLGFPDGDLERYRGKRPAIAGDPSSPDGFTGLEDAFVRVLRHGIHRAGRSFPITRVFFPASSDYHNDHIVTCEQLLISIFHAHGSIWPECGAPISVRPFCYQFAIYCDFAPGEPPNILYRGTDEHFCAKMQAITAFKSQGQIAALVDDLENEGSFELFREVEFRLFSRERQLAPFLNRRYREVP